MSTVNHDYKYLGPREGSPYRQYFVKGSKLRAATLYAETRGPDDWNHGSEDGACR